MTGEIESYRELVRLLAARAPLERIADVATRRAVELLGAEVGSATTVDEDELVYIAAVGRSGLLGRRVPLEGSFTGSVVTGGEARIFAPDSASEGSRGRAAADEIRSGVVAPIRVAGAVVGTLGVASAEARRFDEDDLLRLDGLAGVIGVGLDLATSRDELEASDPAAEARLLAALVATELEDRLERFGVDDPEELVRSVSAIGRDLWQLSDSPGGNRPAALWLGPWHRARRTGRIAPTSGVGLGSVLERVAVGERTASLLGALVEAVEERLPGVVCTASFRSPAPEEGLVVEGSILGDELAATLHAVDGVLDATLSSGVHLAATASDGAWTDLRDDLDACGVTRCVHAPVSTPSGDVVGVLAIHLREERAPTRDELEVFKTALHLLCVAAGHDHLVSAVERRGVAS